MSQNNFGVESSIPPKNVSALFKALATIPLLRKLNLSRNKLTHFHFDQFPELNQKRNTLLPVDKQVFPYLEELYFAFNAVSSEEALIWPVQHLVCLRYLVITGNPFAVRSDAGVSLQGTGTIGTNERAQRLEILLAHKQGQLINETLQPPTYMRKEVKARETLANMINYGNSMALVKVNEKTDWTEGNILEGQPLEIEFN